MDDPRPVPSGTAHENSIWLAIALGGAVGACLRHGVHVLLQNEMAPESWFGFVLPTLLVNLLGAALLGRFTGRHANAESPEWLRAFMTTGVLSSFTTYSGMVVQTHALAANVHPAVAGMALVGSIAAGLLAFTAGERSMRPKS